MHSDTMPTDLSEASTGSGELVFPDDAPGKQYRLREQAVYDAEEVRDEIGNRDVPRYGRWLPVENGDGPGWLSAPSALIEELQRDGFENGSVFEIVTMEQTGPDPSDPYRVEVRAVDDSEQSRF